MPHEDMEGKIIVTNTTRAQDVELLKKVGIKYVITSTPVIDGVSSGTNVLEASIVAISGAKGELSREEYEDFLKEFKIEPNIQKLQ